MIKLIILSVILTGCATKRDWKESHYKNANAAHEAKVLCDSGQKQAALKLGYTCYPRDQNGRIISSVSNSNGNVSNIYINGSQAQNKPNMNGFYKAMETMYNQERNDRLNRICTFNGTCKK